MLSLKILFFKIEQIVAVSGNHGVEKSVNATAQPMWIAWVDLVIVLTAEQTEMKQGKRIATCHQVCHLRSQWLTLAVGVLGDVVVEKLIITFALQM